MLPIDPVTIFSGGMKLLGNLFGRKKEKPMTPAQSIMSTAQGVTDASKATGLNRLTLLGASNATAGAGIDMSGGAPPLASLSVLGDIVEEGFGKEAQQRVAHNDLQNDLLRLEIARLAPVSRVRVAPSAASGGALGRNVQTRVSGPSGDFLNEDDRNPTRAEERDNTVSFQSHGESSSVPMGPDFDEWVSGMIIEANNKGKARKRREKPMTTGTPLQAPWGLVDRTWELLPPMASPVVPKRPKPRPNRGGGVPLNWHEQQFSN